MFECLAQSAIAHISVHEYSASGFFCAVHLLLLIVDKMPLSKLYSREINGVVERFNRGTVYRRRKQIKELLYNSGKPIRDQKLKKMAKEYCENEGLKMFEKDG